MKADLYVDTIGYEGYLGAEECVRCGAESCAALVEKLRSGGAYALLDGFDLVTKRAVKTTVAIEHNLPSVPSITVPRPVRPELVELNEPGPGDPVLVTGNSLFTQEVLLAVLSTTVRPFFVLFADTRGDTLDMAVILESFTARRLAYSVESESLGDRAGGSPLVLPGLARELRDEIATATGFSVEVGPVCAAELPLYFGDRW